jgi:hypothetical protein
MMHAPQSPSALLAQHNQFLGHCSVSSLDLSALHHSTLRASCVKSTRPRSTILNLVRALCSGISLPARPLGSRASESPWRQGPEERAIPKSLASKGPKKPVDQRCLARKALFSMDPSRRLARKTCLSCGIENSLRARRRRLRTTSRSCQQGLRLSAARTGLARKELTESLQTDADREGLLDDLSERRRPVRPLSRLR